MQSNDAEAATVKDYLKKLLLGVWQDRDAFNGKRPFGNSGWQYEIYVALGRGGVIEIIFDEDGYVDSISDEQRDKADRLIDRAIEDL